MSLDTHGDAGTIALDPRMATVKTPLKLAAWQKKLQNHPDKDYCKYILKGIEKGFCLGVDESASFTSSTQNMLSAKQNPVVITEYLDKEVSQGNILGPFSIATAPAVHINCFGVIPKKHQPGKWRMITDLSFPEGHSVNDAIDPEACSLSYISGSSCSSCS